MSARVGITMGSDSDLPVMQPAADVLRELGVECELRVTSAHRTPDAMLAYGRDAADRGLHVLIAGAGGAAHLPGMLAAVTRLPVIGVPVALKHLDGVDSLLSIVQMPRGVPVATVAIDGGRNAGLLAARILALADPDLAQRLDRFRDELAEAAGRRTRACETAMSEPTLQTSTEDLEALEVDAPRVGIISETREDMDTMEGAGAVLDDYRIRYEMRVMSAHCDPELVAEYCKNARMRGLKVIIAGAGLSAALPGVAAAHTDIPVIGVPLSSRLSAAGGLDAILSVVQMPPGVPVAAVGLDNARNAAHLAARILTV